MRTVLFCFSLTFATRFNCIGFFGIPFCFKALPFACARVTRVRSCRVLLTLAPASAHIRKGVKASLPFFVCGSLFPQRETFLLVDQPLHSVHSSAICGLFKVKLGGRILAGASQCKARLPRRYPRFLEREGTRDGRNDALFYLLTSRPCCFLFVFLSSPSFLLLHVLHVCPSLLSSPPCFCCPFAFPAASMPARAH